jgi:MoxR-like ATPase
VDATHESKAAAGVKYGASPRAALGLAGSARARALLQGRLNASFEDVRALAGPVLQHRLVLDYTARIEGRTPALIVRDLLEEVPAQEYELPKTLRAAKL